MIGTVMTIIIWLSVYFYRYNCFQKMSAVFHLGSVVPSAMADLFLIGIQKGCSASPLLWDSSKEY